MYVICQRRETVGGHGITDVLDALATPKVFTSQDAASRFANRHGIHGHIVHLELVGDVPEMTEDEAYFAYELFSVGGK